MKNLLILFAVFFLAKTAQAQVYGGSPVTKGNGNPNAISGIALIDTMRASPLFYETHAGKLWQYEPRRTAGQRWVRSGQSLFFVEGTNTPSETAGNDYKKNNFGVGDFSDPDKTIEAALHVLKDTGEFARIILEAQSLNDTGSLCWIEGRRLNEDPTWIIGRHDAMNVNLVISNHITGGGVSIETEAQTAATFDEDGWPYFHRVPARPLGDSVLTYDYVTGLVGFRALPPPPTIPTVDYWLQRSGAPTQTTFAQNYATIWQDTLNEQAYYFAGTETPSGTPIEIGTSSYPSETVSGTVGASGRGQYFVAPTGTLQSISVRFRVGTGSGVASCILYKGTETSVNNAVADVANQVPALNTKTVTNTSLGDTTVFLFPSGTNLTAGTYSFIIRQNSGTLFFGRADPTAYPDGNGWGTISGETFDIGFNATFTGASSPLAIWKKFPPVPEEMSFSNLPHYSTAAAAAADANLKSGAMWRYSAGATEERPYQVMIKP